MNKIRNKIFKHKLKGFNKEAKKRLLAKMVS